MRHKCAIPDIGGYTGKLYLTMCGIVLLRRLARGENNIAHYICGARVPRSPVLLIWCVLRRHAPRAFLLGFFLFPSQAFWLCGHI